MMCSLRNSQRSTKQPKIKDPALPTMVMEEGAPPKDYDFSHNFEYVNSHNLGAESSFNAGVYVVRRKRDGAKFVEKKYKTEDIDDTAAFEMRVLRKYRHKNIVKYICGFIDRHSYRRPIASMYMEYCNGGNLYEVTYNRALNGRYFSENAIWDIFIQLTNALAWLQYGVSDACFRPEPPQPGWIGVLHRDIKPDNIFLSMEPNRPYPRLLLGDFGQGLMTNDNGKWGRQYMVGNRQTAPPEVREGGLVAYTYAGDTFAVGTTMILVCNLLCSERHLGYEPEQVYSAFMVQAL
ncbi:MAG: hypothetical protein Q9224_006429, partial [Gallowayella concinna]